MACPKEYQFAKVRGISLRDSKQSLHFAIGQLAHVGRAQWFYDKRRGELWREAIVTYARVNKLPSAALPQAIKLIGAYVAHWKLRPHTEVLAVEHTVGPKALNVGDHPQLWRSARYDSIERWKSKAWIGEAKTTSSSIGKVSDNYRLHGQTLLQLALWGPDETARFGSLGGILLDVLVKGTRPTFDRKELLLEEHARALGPGGWFRRDAAAWVQQAARITWDSKVERRAVCVRSIGACPFRALCLRGRRGALMYTLGGQPLHAWRRSPGKETPPWE